MKFHKLQSVIKTPIFFSNDVQKLFPNESKLHLNTQLNRMVKRGDLISLKRGVFKFPMIALGEHVIANKIYNPSYISLETALSIYCISPVTPATVTSITTITSKKIEVNRSMYLFSKINKNLYFGFNLIYDVKSKMYYNLATPEKALLDFIYIRKIKDISAYSLNINLCDTQKLRQYMVYFPRWVGMVIKNA